MKTSENWPHFPKAFSSGLYFRFVLFLYIPIPIPKYSYIPQYSYIFLYLFLYIPIFLYSCIFLYSGKKSSYGGKCMGTIGCLSMEIRDNTSRLIQFIYIPIYSYIPGVQMIDHSKLHFFLLHYKHYGCCSVYWERNRRRSSVVHFGTSN